MAESEEAFEVPVARIATPGHIEVFRTSQACAKLRGFIIALNTAAKGKLGTPDPPHSPIITKLVALLDRLDGLVDETPAVQGSSRFGNPAFKTWHGKLSEHGSAMIAEVLPPGKAGAVIELTPYLLDAFGNATRIDYGSGHELAFVAFLCCLGLLDAYSESDMAPLVTVVFKRYLNLARRVQMTYKQEPAGSHGVWGLDDHQFLCYYWGAAQLVDNPAEVTPADITVEASVRDYREQSLFFGAVAHIGVVKRGPFHEHSRFLYDMSAVTSWNKINSGLLKMFDAEVLYKIPVIQHFLFGTLLPLPLPPRSHAVANDSGAGGGQPALMGQAPWANPPNADGGGMPAAAAPWANRGAVAAMPPTAAPWAKKNHPPPPS